MKNWKKRSKSSKAVSFFIRLYQYTISPDHGAGIIPYGFTRCRFYPSCSAYAVYAVRQYGLLKGGVLLFKRIGRCHPWGRGGYEPLP